jgi:uncharacterized membrane protein
LLPPRASILTDLTYWRTADMMWTDFSALLVTVGVTMTWLAAFVRLIDFLDDRLVREQAPAWSHAIGNAVALVLATSAPTATSPRTAWVRR